MKEQVGADRDIDTEAIRKKYEAERDKRIRPEAVAQYQELKGKLARFGHDPNYHRPFHREPITEEVDVLIVGAGFAGLLAGAHLRLKGLRNLRIVDRSADFGGTWYWNRYPGAACDIESYIYLPMLEETGYMPTAKYVGAAEIFAYCQMLARKYDLYSGALFQTEVHALRWNEERKRWIISTDRNDAIAARFVISCAGLLTKPKLPGIPGIETFQGRAFHTSRWDYAYTGGGPNGNLLGLTDKVVGIIGTGSTGVQSIPHLGRWAKRLYVFQRTPCTIDPRHNSPTDPKWFRSLKPGWQRERMDNFTILTAGGRAETDLVNDSWTEIIRSITPPETGEAPLNREQLELTQLRREEQLRMRIAQTVKDAVTAESLKPYYHYFCKRPCFHDDYLPTFNRRNVQLIDTKGKGVERITANGVVVLGEEYPLDCLIFATGFDWLADYTREFGIEVVGPGGHRLSEHWADGARTLYGIQTHGFPNFLMMNLIQAGGSFNYMTVADEQVRHIAHIIDRCMQNAVETIQPTEQAEADWVDQVVRVAQDRRAFLASCTPGYYNFEGKRSREVELNDFYTGPPMDYVTRLGRWRAEGGFPLMVITTAGERGRSVK